MAEATSGHGEITITLEKYTFYPGEQVCGELKIMINQRIPPSKLYLRFKGSEYARMGFFSDEYKDRRILKSHISNTQYLLMSWDSSTEPNQFSIPFTFLLPPSLPGSFYYVSIMILVKIMYRISARLKADGVKIQTKQQVWIKNSGPGPEPHEESGTIELFSWCCKQKGAADLKVRWINNHYSSTTPLECIVDINNTNGKLPIKGIKLKAYCIVVAAVSLDTPKKENIQFPISFSTIQVMVRPGEKIEGDQGKRIVIIFIGFPSFLEHMQWMRTYEGKLFSCKYFVDFDLDLGICCLGRPQLSSVFHVDSEGTLTDQSSDAPANWNPQVFQVAEIVYDQNMEKKGTHLSQNKQDELGYLDNTKF